MDASKPLKYEWKGWPHKGKGFILGEEVRDRPQDSTLALPPQSFPPTDTPAAVLLEQERGQGRAQC